MPARSWLSREPMPGQRNGDGKLRKSRVYPPYTPSQIVPSRVWNDTPEDIDRLRGDVSAPQ